MATGITDYRSTRQLAQEARRLLAPRKRPSIGSYLLGSIVAGASLFQIATALLAG